LPTGDPFAIDDYAAVGSAISRALDLHGDRFAQINVRFLPFCFLEPHPDCIKTQWQKMHEDHEWDPVLHVVYQRGVAAALAATAAGMLLRRSGPSYRCADRRTAAARGLSRCRMRLYYRQGEPCTRCSVRRICTGLPRAWVGRRGFPTVEPMRLGMDVSDPLHFVKTQTDRFRSLRDGVRPSHVEAC